MEIFFFRWHPNHKICAFFWRTLYDDPRLYTLTDTIKAEIGRKNFAGAGNRGPCGLGRKKQHLLFLVGAGWKFQEMYLMMIQSSSYGGMAIATLVVDIQANKNSFFRQNVVFVDQNVANILTKNDFWWRVCRQQVLSWPYHYRTMILSS